VIASKPVQERFASLGAEAKSSSPERLGQFKRENIARWTGG
jgi:hypothetical protein